MDTPDRFPLSCRRLTPRTRFFIHCHIVIAIVDGNTKCISRPSVHIFSSDVSSVIAIETDVTMWFTGLEMLIDSSVNEMVLATGPLLSFLVNRLWQQNDRLKRVYSTWIYVRCPSSTPIFPNFRSEPPTHCPALIATVVHASLYIRRVDQQSRACNSRKLARYNKYNNNNVYLPLHLYFTLFRLWLTNRYLIVVWTALSWFLSFFQLLFVPFERKRYPENFFWEISLASSCFPSLSASSSLLVHFGRNLFMKNLDEPR